ncbi:MAG: hypothetical protein CO093_10200 [Alphaproteobacteria bacterium CG_4_9_14_3_um_filter_47_13]|nr:MAG: hypothetical protein CO093_10200 [Alphaproteobacteria bacterium CG_4_9_14_3_um_filter_47_13]
MTDSGFSGLPPTPPPKDLSFPQSLAELKAKIIEQRSTLKTAHVRQKMEGEIIRHNPDGTTRIHTEKGELTVELRGRTVPPEGTRVEIDIPPQRPDGTPPQQVTIRVIPVTPPPVSTTTLPPEEPQRLQPQTSPLERGTAENLTRHVATLPAAQPLESLQEITLRPGDLIRLTPLSPAQAQNVSPPVPETIQTQVTALPTATQAQKALQQRLPLLQELHAPALIVSQTDLASFYKNLPQIALPVSQGIPETLPVTAQTPVTRLVQYLLKANHPATELSVPTGTALANPFDNPPSPVLLQPSSAPANVLTPKTLQPVLIPFATIALSVPNSPEAFLLTTQTPERATISQAPSVFDIRIQAVFPPTVKIVGNNEALQTHSLSPTVFAQPLLTAPSAGQMTGEITAQTAQNLPVLSLFLPFTNMTQNFTIPFQAINLPPGAQIIFTPQPEMKGLIQTGQILPLAPFIPQQFFSGFSWPAMEELHQLLQNAAPQLAQALSNITANAAAPARLPAAALFFVAAIRSGDLSSWLGEKTTETLRRLGKTDLLNRLTRDLNGLQRTATEPTGQDWRAMALPMTGHEELHKMMLYYRHDEDKNDKENDRKRGTRFIFDLHLNRMGDVQIDGLFRSGQLDLILRTAAPLSPSMQQTMRSTYLNALEQTSLTGELSFQNKPDQFVKVTLPHAKEIFSA